MHPSEVEAILSNRDKEHFGTIYMIFSERGEFNEEVWERIMNKYLLRPYFKNDKTGFYKNGINMRCLEQIRYQSIRDYDVDYHLVFCDDVNMIYSINESMIGVFPNDINLNQDLFEHHLVTTDAKQAKFKIKEMLDMGKIVLFQTATNYLKTYKWYNSEDDYMARKHKAILIGYDDQFYYYVDSPETRNMTYFNPHPQNEQVGRICKKEFLEAMRLKCKISYIKINENKLSSIAPIEDIIQEIIKNYQDQSLKVEGEMHTYIGRIALVKVIDALEQNKTTFELLNIPFISELFISRHKRLEENIIKYDQSFCQNDVESVVIILNVIIRKWEVIKNLGIKLCFQQNDNTYVGIIKQLNILLKLEDDLIEIFGHMIK